MHAECCCNLLYLQSFPGGSVVKNPPTNVGDMGLIPGLGRSPEEGNGNPLQYSWEIPWTEEPGGLQSLGHKQSDTTERLNNNNGCWAVCTYVQECFISVRLNASF